MIDFVSVDGSENPWEEGLPLSSTESRVTTTHTATGPLIMQSGMLAGTQHVEVTRNECTGRMVRWSRCLLLR